MIRSLLRACVLTLSLSSLAACAGSGARPVLASSASQPANAMKYPDDLAATAKALADRRAEVTQLSSSFATRADELKKTDWDKVLAIVDKADEAGKSAGYAEEQGAANGVRSFWNDERDAINGKVAGNANYAAKQASCTADVGGAATHALKEAIDKQLEKRLRARNDAFSIIDRHRVALGKDNAAALEKLADDVARASYVVHVEMLEQRERLRAKIADRDTVAKTLDKLIEEEKAFQAEAGRTDAEKKASDERIAAAAKSRADLDRAATAADNATKTVDQQIEAAQKEYDDALNALKARIAAKKKAS